MMYNIEIQDIGVILNLCNKLAFWHKKTGNELPDEELQRVVQARDHLNKLLKGTVYE